MVVSDELRETRRVRGGRDDSWWHHVTCGFVYVRKQMWKSKSSSQLTRIQ